MTACFELRLVADGEAGGRAVVWRLITLVSASLFPSFRRIGWLAVPAVGGCHAAPAEELHPAADR
jgi:hypothetical protein